MWMVVQSSESCPWLQVLIERLLFRKNGYLAPAFQRLPFRSISLSSDLTLEMPR